MLRQVVTENGIVRGLPAADPRITSFKGIPFAAPPVGENRWRAPQPAANWDGVYNAFDFAPISMQAKTVIDPANIYTREWAVDPDIPMSEDCLYLNIWTPAKSADEKLPVYVWYFGGGLQVGHTAEMEFDGERIARRGIVVVTVNYRLNVFGFLCHPEITAESPDAPANFGNLDQRFGTLLVKRNIAAFGGDPDNITIGGQSAGGGSVITQLTSPVNEGLFNRAIIQSGMFAAVYPGTRSPGMRRTLKEAEEQGKAFFEFLGVHTLAEARAIDAETLRDKMLQYRAFWGTVEDGVYCVGDGFTRLVRGERLPVPIMFGHTSSEFFSSPQAKNKAELRALAEKLYGDDADKFLAFFDGADDTESAIRARGAVSGIEYAIRVACRANERLDSPQPMYYYNFDAEIPGWDNPGTFHSVDLWFFFETLAKCWRPFTGKHYDLARQMCNYWANFIKTGDPNGDDATGERMPEWKPYTEAEPYGMYFGDKAEFKREPPSDLMKFIVDQYFKKN